MNANNFINPCALAERREASLQTMSPEAQRIAIAEACGWRRIPADNVGAAGRLFYGDVWWRDAENNTIACADHLPDYLNDLNAMHEAEKVLRTPADNVSAAMAADRMHAYVELLGYAIDATAAQRAEAFLRTLNLWTTNV